MPQNPIHHTCIVCGSRKLHYAFSAQCAEGAESQTIEHRIERCDHCELMFINPAPEKSPTGQAQTSGNPSSDEYLERISANENDKRVLVIDIDSAGDFVADDAGDRVEPFDCVLCHDIDRARDPRALVQQTCELLNPNGRFLCTASSLDSHTFKANWREFKAERLFYFNSRNLRALLFQEGLSNLKVYRDQNSICLTAEKKPDGANLKLSVVMPAFNEATTIQSIIDSVLAKQLDDMQLELIIVESNSTDGTSDIVHQYDDHPRVQTIFEDEPKGKGHAVRTGLAAATGDFILIQDADDEYDIEDYDALLEPLRDGLESFILGARHGGSWKIREFSDQPIQGFVLNCGHWVFRALVNVFYGVRLKDPFTMYKVFRRDCIAGLKFECNRFDFDYEILIKLIRRGFLPIEIPVNYRSRSFLEGKKIRMFSDPITWIKAIIKFRFSKLD